MKRRALRRTIPALAATATAGRLAPAMPRGLLSLAYSRETVVDTTSGRIRKTVAGPRIGAAGCG